MAVTEYLPAFSSLGPKTNRAWRAQGGQFGGVITTRRRPLAAAPATFWNTLNRGYFGTISWLWAFGCSSAQRAAWESLASTVSIAKYNGDEYTPDGFQLLQFVFFTQGRYQFYSQLPTNIRTTPGGADPPGVWTPGPPLIISWTWSRSTPSQITYTIDASWTGTDSNMSTPLLAVPIASPGKRYRYLRLGNAPFAIYAGETRTLNIGYPLEQNIVTRFPLVGAATFTSDFATCPLVWVPLTITP